jgi:hypothetical protein
MSKSLSIGFYFVFLLCSYNSLWCQPSNDLCSGATSTVADGTCYNGTLVSANDNISGEVGCATPGGPNSHRDVWYRFTAPTSNLTFNITSPTLSSIEMLLMTGTCSSLTYVNSSCGTSPLTGSFSGLIAGQTYYYSISASNNSTGTFTSCFNAIATPPAAGQNCNSSTQVCNNTAFAGNSSGYGVQEISTTNGGCLYAEHQSSWYQFQVSVGGTIEMMINPATGVDYDFAIWGPNASCPISGSPLRCSYASGLSTYAANGNYNTGLSAGAADVTEDAAGNGLVSPILAVAGQTYFMLIDNFSSNSTPFNLSWGGTGTLGCLVLGLDIPQLSARVDNEQALLQWHDEQPEDRESYIIERAINNLQFEEIGLLEPAAGKDYHWSDPQIQSTGDYYYRLRLVKKTGQTEYSNIAVLLRSQKLPNKVEYFDFTGNEIALTESFHGLVIKRTWYSDGSLDVTKICMP